MIKRFLINPFFVYIITFTIALLVYGLQWSTRYPPLKMDIKIFLFSTFFISAILGLIIDRWSVIQFYNSSRSTNPLKTTVIIFVLYFLEIIYSGNIPIVEVLVKGKDLSDVNFGIPTFHTLLFTFSGYYLVKLFYDFLNTKEKKHLLYLLINLIPAVLVLNRIVFVITIIASFFLIILYIKRIGLRTLAISILFILGLLFIYGWVGNLRSFKGNKEALLYSTYCKESVIKGKIPNEYYWTYLYVASPLGNLQNTVDKFILIDKSLSDLIITQFFPDFISKRIEIFHKIEKKEPLLIIPAMNVSTFYAASYLYYGWFGMVVLFSFFILSTFFYLIILSKSKEHLTVGVSLLLTLIALLFFDNMYTETSLSFQLIYPIIFGLLENRFSQTVIL
jgi:hypothetical protein